MSFDEDFDFSCAEEDQFHPTECELKELARYWYRLWWDYELPRAIYRRSVSGAQARTNARFNQIRKLLGDTASSAIADMVVEEVREQVGDEDFNAIFGGDEVAYARFRLRLAVEKQRGRENHQPEGHWPATCSSATAGALG